MSRKRKAESLEEEKEIYQRSHIHLDLLSKKQREDDIAQRHSNWVDKLELYQDEEPTVQKKIREWTASIVDVDEEEDKENQDPHTDLLPSGMQPKSFLQSQLPTPNPAHFYYTALSLKDKAQIYKALVSYCHTEKIHIGSCKAFIRPWLKLASEALICFNKIYGTPHNRIPISLTRQLASYLWPVEDDIIWRHEIIGEFHYTFIALGWCAYDKGGKDGKRHLSYAVDGVTEPQRRTPAHVFVLHAWPSSADRILSKSRIVSSMQLAESGYTVRINHLTHPAGDSRHLTAQAQMAIWKYGGIHEYEGYPVPLHLFDPIDLDYNFEF